MSFETILGICKNDLTPKLGGCFRSRYSGGECKPVNHELPDRAVSPKLIVWMSDNEVPDRTTPPPFSGFDRVISFVAHLIRSMESLILAASD